MQNPQAAAFLVPTPEPQTLNVTTGQLDWDALRARSLAPGGFGADRAVIWPQLLHVDPEVPAFEVAEDPHEDERQIRLDTDRSFVLYPVEENMTDREERQEELRRLIVQIFRRRPGLSYFQGYHDIITVLMLSLPPTVALPAAEKVSLHRLRDSMGHTLEPLMGLMRILQRLLRQADPDYATLLEEQSPLPYTALSHLLTLFSHDVPTLPLIQHIFDYLFSRPPISVVYLAAAFILARKDEVEMLEREGEEGMIHSVLSGIPDLIDRPEGEEDQEDKQAASRIPEGRGSSLPKDRDESTRTESTTEEDVILPLALAEPDGPLLDSSADETHNAPTHSATTLEHLDDPVPSEPPSAPKGTEEPIGAATSEPEPESSASSSSHSRRPSLPPSDIPSPPEFGSPPLPPTLLKRSSSPSPARTGSPSPPPHRRRVKLSLPDLLNHADNLFAQFPPTDPALLLDRIMGPASAMRTWSENPARLPPDDAAEALIVASTDIVLPWNPEDDLPATSSVDSNDEDLERTEKTWFRRRRGLEKGKEKVDSTRKRRKLRKRNRPVFGARVERRTMLAGAALVLGVAMAVSVYGMHANGRGGGINGDLRKMGRVLGGIVGVGERLWHAAEGFAL
ncbi:hypothetical protein FA95DRAFT_1553787 [Auriscalpium vulgare]|uniref:Uncharacterized protein n=1 Tax=Auriscalpium vulgare TaxID=40419 RepID=A0ACB8S7E6_9AGAM|nr:hypothetical protein FA95DRAFT_1553787 [Auriscalpium vulgare]